jgi:hypothetical protein
VSVKPPQAVLVDTGLEEPVIVHSWPAGRAIPDTLFLGSPAAVSPMEIPKGEISRRSAGWRILKDTSPGWDILETENALIHGQGFGRDFLRSVGVYLEEFNIMLRSTIGGPPTRGLFALRIYSDRSDFCRRAACLGASNAESLYDPIGRVMDVVPDPTKPDFWFQRILAHEFVHAYMHLVFGISQPLWFAEGMAEFFSNFSWQDGMLAPGALNPEVLRRLKLGRQSLVPVFEFVNLGREVMYGMNFAMLYAEAWALIHYLMDEQPEEIQTLLSKGPAVIDEGAFERHLDQMLESVELPA